MTGFEAVGVFEKRTPSSFRERDSIYDTWANGVPGSVKMRLWANCLIIRRLRANQRPNRLDR
jgi:hypothetical protein